MRDLINKILSEPADFAKVNIIGESRDARPIAGYVFGKGPIQISLIGGCHADEPVGPTLLKKFVNFLLNSDHFNFLNDFTFHIVPHVNPDGEAKNRKWYTSKTTTTSLFEYLKHAIRELPGEDIEFGFPIEGQFAALRPENEAVYDFWKSANTPFDLHVSLHGMNLSYGPWFLIDETWQERVPGLIRSCSHRVSELGYELHDVDRKGEKGFRRITKGFCTRPNSQAMRDHFFRLNQPKEAAKFHPSSMESVRSLGGDCLTLVTEMPLFIVPRTSIELQWPDPVLSKYGQDLQQWRGLIQLGKMTEKDLNFRMQEAKIASMSWHDQMRLQWELIVSGLEVVKQKRLP